jgi:hypothetical protein
MQTATGSDGEQIKVGELLSIAEGTTKWGGKFKVLKILKVFANGKVSVMVNFHGKAKVFHI